MRSRSRSSVVGVALAVSGCGAVDIDESGTSSDTGGDEDRICAPISIDVERVAGERRLELVATVDAIPGIDVQPTTHGRILGTLFPFDGRVHLGYGDYSANTGPIMMAGWDPADEAFVQYGEVDTEEVLRFGIHDGRLFSPTADPTGHQADGGVFVLRCEDTEWSTSAPIGGAVHVYDIANHEGRLWASTGSLTGAPALVVSSDDHGQTWREEFRRESPAGQFSRFYFLGATADTLFASGREHPDPGAAFAWSRDDTGTYTEVADVPASGYLVPLEFGGELLLMHMNGNPGRASVLGTYRLEQSAVVADDGWLPVDGAQLLAWARDGESLVVVVGDGTTTTVARTDDRAVWEVLAELPALADGDSYASIAPLLNDLYLGTRGGGLYAIREIDTPL